MARIPATLAVSVSMAVISLLLFSTPMGLPLLDVMDKWANEYGIVAAAAVSTIVVSYVVRGLPTLRDHLNQRGTFPIGRIWMLCVAVIAPLEIGRASCRERVSVAGGAGSAKKKAVE